MILYLIFSLFFISNSFIRPMLLKFTNLSILEEIFLPTGMTDPHSHLGFANPRIRAQYTAIFSSYTSIYVYKHLYMFL